MEINVNIRCDEQLTKAIIRFSDALELIAKKGIGNVLYKNDLVEEIANEVLNKKEEKTEATNTDQATQVFTPVVEQPQQPTVPVTEISYNIEQLAVAATQLVDAGKRDSVVATLNKYNVNSLKELSKANYGAFATDLRALGANI